ncbi:hypothetical protein SDC9_173466 [bioreactor metagenome]|uniref:Uncharacterized protein n=1 Tax=bioreactor metagenome TaxID=1076179 RepID=A0A645GQ07_9ZZZZ
MGILAGEVWKKHVFVSSMIIITKLAYYSIFSKFYSVNI